MQSIYFSNKINKINNFNAFKIVTSQYPQIKSSNFTLDLFCSEGNESIYKKGSDFITNLGVFIYKKQFNSIALELFFQDLESGQSLKELLVSDVTQGQFCLYLYTDGVLRIITDRLGYFPQYCYDSQGIVELSNSFISLVKNNKGSLNKQGIAEYLSENIEGYACCDKNIVNEISYLDGGSIYTYNGQKLEQERYYILKDDLEFGKYESLEEVADLAEEILQENISFLKNVKGKIHCDITGGMDTRVNLAILVKNNMDVHYGVQLPLEYKHYTNTGKYSELNVVKKIAHHYNLNIEINHDTDFKENKKAIEDVTFNMSNKQTYSRRTSYFMRLKEKNKINLVIGGLSGTELSRQPYLRYFKNNQDIDLDIFIREHYPLVDVIKDEVLTAEDYFSHLKEFFEKELEGLKYDKVEDIGNYIDFFAFFRTHFCRYMALTNSVIPFYTTYGEFKFAKLMFETAYKTKARFAVQRTLLSRWDPELAAINSTRGFPLARVTVKNFYRFRNMINQNIPQQYFSIITKMKRVIAKRWLKFLFSNERIYNFFIKMFPAKKEQSSKLNLLHDSGELSIISVLKKTLEKDLPVFEIVDKKKLEKIVKNDCNFNILNRVFFLNDIIEFAK